MINKIISGGQTGVDRAAHDAAIFNGLDIAGWCPKGRIDENGIIPDKYSCLTEVAGSFASEAQNYNFRTMRNIEDSDGTLVLVPAWPLPETIKDGTILTLQHARSCNKPLLILVLNQSTAKNHASLTEWLYRNSIKALNIAGPRESSQPGIYDLSFNFLQFALSSNYYL